MTQGRKNFPTKAAIKRGCLAHDSHTHLVLDRYTTRGGHTQSKSNMATTNFCHQPTDYVSKILTEKRKVSSGSVTHQQLKSPNIYKHFSAYNITSD